jgi:hypothetical protein
MPAFFGQIDAIYTDLGGDVWAHPTGGAQGLPPDQFLHFAGLPGTQGSSTFATAAAHAKATNSNAWIFYSVPDAAVTSMYVF